MDVIMPQLGETVAEGTVTKWYKKVGDAIKADEALFDVETDKVSTEIPAPASGVLTEIIVQEGTTAKVGETLAVIRESAPRTVENVPTRVAAAPMTAALAAAQEGSTPPRISASPLERYSAEHRLSPVVRRLLAEHTLDPNSISGSGRNGRITREDVLNHIGRRAAAGAPMARSGARSDSGNVPLTNIRRRTAEHMTKSWTTVPHVLQVVEADFSRVDQARRAAGAAWKNREGYTLTYLPFIAHAIVAALAKFPRLNSSFSGEQLVLHPRVNLGIAVDLSLEGLLVPVVKDASGKTLPALARAINDVATRARTNKLRPDDVTEGTYTVSNNGAFGTLITAPIISPPQVAILSTDAISKRPVVIEGPDGDSIAIRPVGMLAQTFDHRAVDGAYAASFLKEVKKAIETRDWKRELEA